jgi:hypothetical protein
MAWEPDVACQDVSASPPAVAESCREKFTTGLRVDCLEAIVADHAVPVTDVFTVMGPDQDPMQLEAEIASRAVAATPLRSGGQDLLSPELGPWRSVQLSKPRFIASFCDDCPGIRAGTPRPKACDGVGGPDFLVQPTVLHEVDKNCGWEVMELELVGPTSCSSSDDEAVPSLQQSVWPLEDAVTESLGSPSDLPSMLERRVCCALQTPVLRGRPTLRVARHQESAGVQRRSGRLAAKVKAENPTLQAQKVLMLKWGMMDTTEQSVHTEANNKYDSVFTAPLSDSKHEAFKELFPEDSYLDDFVPEVDGLLPEAC